MFTDLARTAWEGFSDGAEAQRYLDEALALVPNHLPAILAVADIHYKEGQWELAEKRLTEAVRRLRGQPQQAAKLFQRLAEVHEKLGKLDEAYRQLVEADRMGPGQLLTKLSLGENRFRAGRWREAAMHLGSLADHPDAALYPEEVADALAHAAQAEIKLRHPERAIELYESALKLRGNHRPTLRALAELALERGEKEKAAIYLRRIAEDSSDRMERAQMFERLGDLCVELNDEPQALAAYDEAVKAYNVPGEEQVSLLEKVLKLQRSTGATEAAGPDLRAARRPGEGSQGARRAPPRRRVADGGTGRRARGGGAAGAGAGRGSAGRSRAGRAVRPRPIDCPRASGCRTSWRARSKGWSRRPRTRRRDAGAPACGSATPSWRWRERRRPSPPSRRSSRWSRSIPSSSARARRWRRCTRIAPATKTPPSRITASCWRWTSRAPIRCARWPPPTRNAGWSIARAAVTRCCPCSGSRPRTKRRSWRRTRRTI